MKDKFEEASALFVEFESRYGHTKTYLESVTKLKNLGVSKENPGEAYTAQKLIELENALFLFKAQTGDWPEFGQIRKPLDAWNNETYWVFGSEKASYDMLILSSGPDSRPGSGDELMIVLTRKKPGSDGKKDPDNAKPDSKQGKSRVNSTEHRVMSLDELKKLEAESGTPSEHMISLDTLATAGKLGKKAGQPKEGETVLSLEELKSKF